LDSVAGELPEISRAHALAFVALAESCKSRQDGPEEGAAWALLEAERPNIHAAFNWAIEQGETDVLVRLWIALGLFWLEHGHLREARDYAQTVLDVVPVEKLDPAVQVDVLGWAFGAFAWVGEPHRAEELARKRMDAAERTGNAKILARAADSLAASLGMNGKPEEALR